MAPTASFTATPSAGAPPLLVAFDANGSTDPDGVINSYAWDFGDGNSGTGVTVNHTYTAAGDYTAQLIVTDDSAASDTFTLAISVNALNVAPTASFTATPSAGAPPLLVAFDANGSTDPDGVINSYAWDFGDGNSGTGVTVNHTYTAAGDYTAQLIVTDDSAASDTFTLAISVNALNVAPTASFTATPSSGAPPLLVAFDANGSTDPDGVINSYAWDFGDGNSGTGVTVNHTYTAAGDYTAQLIVTDDSAASDTFTLAIAVRAPNTAPKATILANPLSGAPPLLVSFDASNSSDTENNIVSYAWDFGDGNTGNGVTINHTYLAEGTYTAQLIVSDDSLASDTSTVEISVQNTNQAPVADFSTDTLAGEAPVTISFDGSASVDTGGTIVSYQWIFGDGNTGTGVTTTHEYTTGGIYIPQLIVTDDEGATDTTSKVIFIQNPGDTASADLRFVDTLSCPGNTFTATIQIRSSNARFFKIGTSSILFTYNDTALQYSGYRSMSFDGSDLCIAGVANAWDVHNVDGTSVPGTVNLTMVLNSEQFSCPEINGFDWISIGQVEFTVLNDALSPNLVFDTTNTNFNVDQPNDGTVEVGKANFQSLTGNILACPNNAPPVAAFTPTPSTGTAPLLVSFDANASSDPDGTLVSYEWTYGDGNTGTGVTATHTYTTAGNFTAQLIVIDDLGGRDTTSALITVLPGANQAPIANFTATPDSGSAPLTVLLDATTSSDIDGTIQSYNWDFGDTQTGTGNTISHVFDTAGIYLVQLIVTDDSAASDTAFLTITVTADSTLAGPSAAITLTDSIGSSPLAIGFDASASADSSANIVSYEWDYGDGVQDTGRTAIHTYTNPGTYQVRLIVSNDQGGQDTAFATVQINPGNVAPVASITATPDSGSAPLIVSFDAGTSSDSDGNIVYYGWDLGNGTQSTGMSVTDTFTQAGLYNVRLFVRDDDGAMDTASFLITVVPPVDTIPVAELRFADSLDCGSDTFVATIQIRAANTDTLRLGTSSILFTYNDTALEFVNYRSLNFDGSDLCIGGVAGAWDPHAFDGSSVPGSFNLTMVLTSEQFSCPDVLGLEWVSIGQVIFTVKDSSLNPTLVFDTTNTNFNVDQPNDGTVSIGKGNFNSLLGEGILLCPENIPPVAAFTASPDTGLVPMAVAFDASASFDEDGQIVSFEWAFGDGNTATGRTSVNTYTAAGTYSASLIVRDNEGATDTLIVPILIRDANQAPIASFTNTPVGNAPIDITFDASTSSDPDGIIQSYFWDFGNGRLDTGIVVTDSFTSAGYYTVSLVVVDDLGARDTATQELVIQPPFGTDSIADLRFADTLDCNNGVFTATLQIRSANIQNFKIGTSSIFFSYNDTALQFLNYESYTFDGSDQCINGIASAWDVHAFDGTSVPGSFNLTMVLNSETFSCPEINGLDWVNIGKVSFTVLDSALSPRMVFDTTNTNFNVDQPNDGSIEIQKGNFAALDGNFLICPDNEAPLASFVAAPTTGDAPLLVNFDASASSDSDGTLVSYAWDFGDGNTDMGINPAHTYLSGGVYLARLIVTDDLGATDTAFTSIVVNGNGQAPIASFTTAPDSVNAPISIGFDATTSVDADGTIISYSWDFGDGNVGAGITTNHTYNTAGLYNARLIVTDDGGLRDTTFNIVTVLPVVGTDSIADLRFVDTLDCASNTFTATLQIRSANTQNFKIGTSSVFFNYNDSALQFSSYESYTFDGSDQCISGVANAWDVHAFDGNSVPGSFNLTMVLNSETFSCPEINGLEWVSIGKVSFTVLDSSLTPDLVFDTTNTNFNVDQPNDGSVEIQKGNFAALLGTSLNCTGPQGPLAQFIATPTTGVQPLTVSFDANTSLSGDTSIVSYEWDFGDGNTGVGVIANNVYTTDGIYTAKLVVTDGLGRQDSTTEVITVLETPGGNPTANLRIVDSLDCDNKILIARLQIQSAALQNFKLGTSSIFLTYNDTALSYNSYNSLSFDGSDLCIGGLASAWDVHTVDGTSIPGNFNMTMVLNTEGFGCPEITGTEWVDIGEVRFDVLNSTMNPRVLFDSTNTNFNVDLPNDGTIVVQKDSLIGLDSLGLLICPGNLSPTASFTADPIAGEPPLIVNFDASSSIDADGTILSYVWDYGDGTGSTGLTSTHAYTTEGTFTASLIVTDDGGISDTTSLDIVVTIFNIAPLANFTINPLNGNAPIQITFDGGSSVDADGNIISYTWIFGDGTPNGTGITTTHTYAAEGNYTAQLIVTDDSLASDTATIVIPIGAPNDLPIANFTFNPTTGEAPLQVNFNASASMDPDGTIENYAWDFGDGNNGTGITPTHTYTQGGTYTISLAVTDNRGETGTFSRQIVVAPGNQSPVARYTATPITGEAPLTVAFNGNTSTDPDGTIQSYAWNFGDGTNGTGITASHTYTAPGIYVSSLTVTDNDGATGVASIVITVVAANQPPVAAFTPTPTSGPIPLAVSFNASASNDSDGVIQTYAWNFGDGNTGTGVNTNHTYTVAGTYTVTLTVTDEDNASATATATIVANPPLNVAPTATFTANPLAGAPPLLVSFNASGSVDPDGTIVSYAWTFGDGNTGTGVNPTHTYQAEGDFVAQLIVTDDSAASDTFSITIAVNANNVAPTATFIANPLAGAPPLLVSFDASGSLDPDGTIVSYNWNFGDGNSGTGVTPTHTYQAEGDFVAQLIVTDDSAASDTFSITIAVNANNVAPTATFTANPLAGAPPLLVSFDASGSLDPDGTIVSYLWNFGDGNSGTGVTPTHTYQAEGDFVAQLIVTDDSAASDTFSITIAVNANNVAPTATFTADPLAGAPPLLVSFDASGSIDPDGTIVSYAWTFGDGNTGTGVTPTHTYQAEGDFVAQLIVTDDSAASDTFSITIAVNANNVAPTATFTADPLAGAPPLLVSFDASGSIDPDGTIVSYAWTFGDGNTGTGVTPTHTYQAEGDFVAQLIVTDDSAASDTFSITIAVNANNVLQSLC